MECEHVLVHCSEDEKLCSVCLCDYEDGDLIRQLLPCRHDFHCKCIDQVSGTVLARLSASLSLSYWRHS